jgi:hypothetical protein
MAHNDDLPVPDYDQLSFPDLRHRIRGLDEAPLRALVDHETEHGNRVPVLEVLLRASRSCVTASHRRRRRAGSRDRPIRGRPYGQLTTTSHGSSADSAVRPSRRA